MKKLLFGLFILLGYYNLAQSVPNAINYQAVARNSSGSEITNTAITVRFSIGSSSVTNTTYAYQEVHNTSTNQFGLFNLVIGDGTPSGSSGAFGAIPWNTPQYLLVEVDFGTGFEQMGVATPFVSVPYALLAKDVLNKELPQTATTNDVLTWDGSQWVSQAPGSISETTTTLTDNGDGTFTYTNEAGTPVTFDANLDDADADATNEIQDLQLSGNTLTITNNGSANPIDLSIYSELPASATTGQVLTWDGSQWIGQNPGTGADNWGSQVVETDATLSGNGTTASPLSGFDGDYNNLSNQPTIPTLTSELTNDSGFLTSEVDGDATNEIQDLAISGNSLNISGGGTGTPIAAVAPSTAGQVLTWDGSQWIAQNPGAGADNWGTQTVVTDATLTGDGTTGNPLSGFDGDYTSLSNQPTIPTLTSELTNDSGFLTSEVDGDATNEIQDLSVSGNSINISGGGTSASISSIAPSDGQVLTWNNTTGGWEAQTPATFTDTDDQTADVFQLSGNNLELSLENDGVATQSVDLSGFMDNTDAQTLTLSTTGTTNTLAISGGNSVSFTVDDNDSDPTNEYNTNFAVNGTNLEITDGGGTLSVPLSSLSTLDADWTKTGTTVYNLTDQIGIGTSTPDPLALLHVEGPDAPMILVKETIPTSGSGIILESQKQYMLHSNESGDFKLTDIGISSERVVVEGATGNIGIGAPSGGIGSLVPSGKALTILTENAYSTTDPATLELIGTSATGTDFMGRLAYGYVIGAGSYSYLGGIDMDKISNMMFNTNGVEQMRIEGTGDVGIGTTNPSAKVDIVSSDFRLLNLETTGSNSNVNISTTTTGGGATQFSMSGGTGGYTFYTSSNPTTPGLRIADNNSVGINVAAAPISALDVNGQITMQSGAVAGYIPVSDASGTMTWTDPSTITTGNDGDWTKSGTTIYNTTDNVGIGTTGPSAKVDIVSATSGSAGSALHIANSINEDLLTVRDDGWVGMNTTTGIGAANFVLNDPDNSGYGGMHVNTNDNTTGQPFYGLAVNNSPIAWMYLDVAGGNNLKFYNGGDRMIVTNAGDVSIGSTTPVEKLDVDGNVQADNYFYSAPKTRYLTIGETDFRRANQNDGALYSTFGNGGVGIVSSSGSNAMVAPIYLPQGAVITEVLIYYIDNSSSNMTIYLDRRSLFGSLSNIASFTTSSASTSVLSTTMTPNHTIDNSNNAYSFRIYSSGWPSTTSKTMEIRNIRITYTITETD